MSDQEVFLVCEHAEAPMNVPGSSFRHRCSKCNRRVMVAPSGLQLLRERPGISVLCVTCFREFKDPKFVGMNEEQIAEAKQPSVPNLWKERN
jgi:hypothetical protein